MPKNSESPKQTRSTGHARTARLSATCRPDELELLQRAADVARVTLSEFIRVASVSHAADLVSRANSTTR